MAENEQVRRTVTLPDDLYRQLRHYAVDRDLSANAALVEITRERLTASAAAAALADEAHNGGDRS